MRPIEAGLLQGSELYREVILDKLAHARESVDIATSNLKDMHVERDGRFDSALALFSELSGRGVSLRLLHAELPSRPFRASFEKRRRLTGGGLLLKICPRVHFKSIVVDGAWAYFGSANFTGAGLGAKSEGRQLRARPLHRGLRDHRSHLRALRSRLEWRGVHFLQAAQGLPGPHRTGGAALDDPARPRATVAQKLERTCP